MPQIWPPFSHVGGGTGTVFRLVDTDGSGDVDADEFAIWLGHRKSLQQRQQELQDKIDALRARQDAKNIPEVDELFDRGEHEVCAGPLVIFPQFFCLLRTAAK